MTASQCPDLFEISLRHLLQVATFTIAVRWPLVSSAAMVCDSSSTSTLRG
jgi:hypothetical protein